MKWLHRALGRSPVSSLAMAGPDRGEGDVGLVDIHIHLLPAVDDGPPGWDDAIAMARVACEAGIRVAVATPHVVPGKPGSLATEDLAGRVEKLRQYLFQTGVQLTVLAGAEVYPTPELVGFLQHARQLPTLGWPQASRYLLLDTPFDLLPPNYERLLFEVRLAGLVPVLAHPERSRVLASDPGRLGAYVAQGVLAQVTAGSLLGEFGPQAQLAAWVFLERGWAHAVASDGHDAQRRSPASLAAAFRHVSRRLGEELALRLFRDNPEAMALGRPLPQAQVA